jgi:hypothetical protein
VVLTVKSQFEEDGQLSGLEMGRKVTEDLSKIVTQNECFTRGKSSQQDPLTQMMVNQIQKIGKDFDKTY